MFFGLLLAVFSSGCGRQAEATVGTGSRECLRTFFDAVIQQDWPAAHAGLDSESQQACSRPNFSQLGRAYLRGLGFEPTAVHVRFCEERGEEATGHIVLTGLANTQNRRYKDSVFMRRGENGWGVVLPSSWGAE